MSKLELEENNLPVENSSSDSNSSAISTKILTNYPESDINDRNYLEADTESQQRFLEQVKVKQFKSVDDKKRFMLFERYCDSSYIYMLNTTNYALALDKLWSLVPYPFRRVESLGEASIPETYTKEAVEVTSREMQIEQNTLSSILDTISFLPR